MFLSSKSRVQDQLVIALARGGPQSAEELRRQLTSNVSIQSVYQELRALTRAGVTIKAAKRFTLKLAWVSEFQELARSMNETSLQSIETFSSPAEKRQRWIFNDFQSAINLWAQLTCALARTMKTPLLLEWAPHAIYHFLNSELELQFQHMLRRERVQFYLIVGAATPLDRSYESVFREGGTAISFAASPFEKFADEFFSVIGDYLIRVRPERQFMRDLDLAYETSARISPAQASALSRLLNGPVKVRLELLYDPARTTKLRRKFADYFGNPSLRIKAR